MSKPSEQHRGFPASTGVKVWATGDSVTLEGVSAEVADMLIGMYETRAALNEGSNEPGVKVADLEIPFDGIVTILADSM